MLNPNLSPQDDSWSDEEKQVEKTLRPKALVDFKGQPKIVENLKVFIAAAKQRGELDPDISVADAVTLWGSYYSFVLFQALQAESFDVEEQMGIYERLMQQHFRGIQSRASGGR